MVKMSVAENCEQVQADLSSSDFSVISHPPDDSLANGLQFMQLSAPGIQLPLDDFRTQLQELLKENAELKGALQQNTAVMRQHFQTLSDWQEKVATANQRHRRMLEDSSRLLLESRQENKLLVTQIQKLELAIKIKEDNECVSREAAEFMELKKDEETSASPFLYVDEDAGNGYTVVHHLPSSGKNDMQTQLQEEKARSSILTQKLAEEQLKNTRLEKQLSGAYVLESRLDQASSYLQQYKDRCTSIDQRLSEHENRISQSRSSADDASLKEELSVVRGLLMQEQNNREDDKKSLVLVRERIERLLDENDLLLNRLKSTQSEGRQTEVLRAIEKRQQQELSDSLTAQLVGTQEELIECKHELEQMKNQLEMLRHDSEQVPILRAQVEIYQQDFDSERRSRERKQAELEKTREDYNNLQLQNEQLIGELNVQQTERHHRRSHHRLSPTHAREANPTVLEPCPKCKMVFGSDRALQNHVEQCLDSDQSPYP